MKISEEATRDAEMTLRMRNRRRARNRQRNTVLAMGMCILLALLVTGGCVLLIRSLLKPKENIADVANLGENIKVSYTKEEVDVLLENARKEGAKQTLDALEEGLNGSGTLVEKLRPLYQDKLVVVSNGKYHFIPIDTSLQMNSYKEENLRILENGFVEYEENGTVISHKGIDVSKHQGEIDWEKVAADGIEFAFIRVGNRGYGSGVIVEDEQFEANVKGAVSNGIKVGVYFFSQAVNVEEALEEAAFVLEKIAPYRIDCPVVMDVEKVADSGARMNKISVEERTANTLAFLEKIEEAGYTAMLYHNMEMSTLLLDIGQFEKYDKWFAYYNKEFYYPYAFEVWQYSAKGRVNGIAGEVDLNISFHLWENKD